MLEKDTDANDAYAKRLAARLNDTLQGIDPNIVERLRFARTQALAMHRAAPTPSRSVLKYAQSALVPAGVVGDTGGWKDGSWRIRAALGAILLGLAATIYNFGNAAMKQHTQELSEVDMSILTDDLPPGAYMDAGFTVYLQQSSINRVNQSHD